MQRGILRVLLGLLCFFCTLSASAQDQFDKYMEMNGATAMEITPSFFHLISDVKMLPLAENAKEEKMIHIISGMNKVCMISSGQDSIQEKIHRDFKAFVGSKELKEYKSKDTASHHSKVYTDFKNKRQGLSIFAMSFTYEADKKYDGFSLILIMWGKLNRKEVKTLTKLINL